MEKIVTARKTYFCDHCLRRIERGGKYTYGTTREPMYSGDVMDNAIQTGIEYIQWRLCHRDDCDTYGASFDEDDIRGETRHLANMRGRRKTETPDAP